MAFHHMLTLRVSEQGHYRVPVPLPGFAAIPTSSLGTRANFQNRKGHILRVARARTVIFAQGAPDTCFFIDDYLIHDEYNIRGGDR